MQHPQLVESQGRASAALMNKGHAFTVLVDHDGDLAITSMSNNNATTSLSSPNTIKASRSKLMSAFNQSSQPYQSALIAVEVPNMGRMAIHRNEALQINGVQEQSSRPADTASSSGSSSSSAGLSAESLSTNQTSVTQPEDDTFDSSIHSFLTDPHSENNSKEGLKSSHDRHASLLAIMREATANLPRSTPAQSSKTAALLDIDTLSNDRYKPRLEGAGMPTLNWPDSIDGPWSRASQHLTSRNEKKRKAIQLWLEEDSDEDTPSEQQAQQHPMIAKVLLDRKRQEDIIRAFASSEQSAITPVKPKKRGRKPLLKTGSSTTPSKRKLAKLRRSKVSTPSSLRHQHLPDSVSPSSTALMTPSRRTAAANAQIGCRCGRADDGTPMILCDGCNSWYHMGCMGLTDTSSLGDEDWFCILCCEVATSILTPGSSLSGGLMVTPSFPRSAALAGQQIRLSQGQLPVFYQADDTPMHLRRDDGHAHAFSSALALAPSPVVLSGTSTDDRRASLVAGRARANRYGWHLAEQGSPLERKSNSNNLGASHHIHKRNLSGSGTSGSNSMHAFTHSSPTHRQSRTFAHAHSDGDLYGTLNSAGGESAGMSAYLRTPSPRLMSSTPKRQRQASTFGLRTDHHGAMAAAVHSQHQAHRRRETSGLQRDFEDVFSTPSRILHGSSSWGQQASMLRHNREESNASINGGAGLSTNAGTPWGLSTPTRHLMDAGFNSDYSAGGGGGLPSLVHSSGGLDMGEFTGWHNLQNSPTSNTRAVRRARQASHARRIAGNGNGEAVSSSSMRETTPERVFEYDAGSSSPFPKTPTFSSDPYAHHRLQSSITPTAASSRTANGTGAGGRYTTFSPISSPTTTHSRAGRMAKVRLGSLGGGGGSGGSNNESYLNNRGREALNGLQGPVELRSTIEQSPKTRSVKSSNGSTTTSKARGRDASTDMMAGLGIGLDLNDVIDWA
ncbi:uncharacterized protein FA14DRAFT_154978 [Meira miltonrushii]|uniref:PHD-type domain-containing protein n=1 Tax=Meira miltonrushii TaxID=1280837 RepID=A0A316VE10_9BASI|nr:uncharacterized protein FA14DRAFT_154978 [Meira miltonrushii]PWN35564.1 hypothetical protein FA14DRAFT_154978 [Meira miltonrushii]